MKLHSTAGELSPKTSNIEHVDLSVTILKYFLVFNLQISVSRKTMQNQNLLHFRFFVGHII